MNEQTLDKCKCGIKGKLVSLTDDGKGKRFCRKCKRKIRKENPDKDYRKVRGEE